MKNKISRYNRWMMLAMAGVFSAFLLGGTTQAQPYNGYQNGYQNQNGYWDRNGNYHHYGYYHNHRGYWNQSNGVRLWINVG